MQWSGLNAGTFRAMSDAVDSGIPLVLVKGSGGAADFMVDMWEQLHCRTDDKFRKGRVRLLPPWAKAKVIVKQQLLKKYGSMDAAFIALDTEQNG